MEGARLEGGDSTKQKLGITGESARTGTRVSYLQECPSPAPQMLFCLDEGRNYTTGWHAPPHLRPTSEEIAKTKEENQRAARPISYTMPNVTVPGVSGMLFAVYFECVQHDINHIY